MDIKKLVSDSIVCPTRTGSPMNESHGEWTRVVDWLCSSQRPSDKKRSTSKKLMSWNVTTGLRNNRMLATAGFCKTRKSRRGHLWSRPWQEGLPGDEKLHNAGWIRKEKYSTLHRGRGGPRKIRFLWDVMNQRSRDDSEWSHWARWSL